MRRVVMWWAGWTLVWSTPVIAQAPRSPCYPARGARIAHVLLHFDPTLREAVAPAWGDLARGLGAQVRFTIACADERAGAVARQTAASSGLPRQRLDVVVAGRPLSIWARDASLVLESRIPGIVGFAGRGDRMRLGDLRAARLLAAQSLDALAMVLPLDLDGGEVVCGIQGVFLGAGRAGAAVGARRAEQLAVVLGASVHVVAAPLGAPHPHLDMYFAAAGDDRVVVAAAGELAAPALRAQCDAVAAELAARGLLVARVPLVSLPNGRLLSWTNVVTESRDGAVAYVPAYGVPQDQAAHAVWRRLGFRVVPIDCATLVAWGGAVRCLTNVLRWEPEVPLVTNPPPAAAADRTPHCDPRHAGAAR